MGTSEGEREREKQAADSENRKAERRRETDQGRQKQERQPERRGQGLQAIREKLEPETGQRLPPNREGKQGQDKATASRPIGTKEGTD